MSKIPLTNTAVLKIGPAATPIEYADTKLKNCIDREAPIVA